jgi:hypothetical protein
MMLDHYAFADGDPGAHLPPNAKGFMGPASPELFKQMREMLRRIFNRPS